jgi:hypothetical protein
LCCVSFLQTWSKDIESIITSFEAKWISYWSLGGHLVWGVKRDWVSVERSYCLEEICRPESVDKCWLMEKRLPVGSLQVCVEGQLRLADISSVACREWRSAIKLRPCRMFNWK